MRAVVIVALFFLVFGFSCAKEEPVDVDETSKITIPSGDESVLIVGTPYFEKTTDSDGRDTFQQIEFLAKGKTVTLLDGRKYDFKIGETSYTVGPARLQNGREVYIVLWYLLPKQRLAVVTAAEEARVFNGLTPVDVTSIRLPRGTIIGVAPIESGDDNKLGRQRMVCYQDKDGKVLYLGTWIKYYVSGTEVSESKSDLDLASTLADITKVADRSQWKGIIDDAIKLSPNSVFVSDARELQAETEDAATAPKTRVAYSNKGIINDSDVNIRKDPDETAQNIIGRLNNGDIVIVTARSDKQYAVDNAYDYWYEIESGDLSGWIFGKYMDISN